MKIGRNDAVCVRFEALTRPHGEIMKFIVSSLAAVALLASTAANAAIVTTSQGASTFPGNYAPGTTLVTFDNLIVGGPDTNFSTQGFNFTAVGGSGGGIRTNSVPSAYAQPATSSDNYLSVGVGGPYPNAVTLSSANDFTTFSLLWGSIDSYNEISFFNDGVQVGSTFTGAAFAQLPSGPNGNQVSDDTNRYVFFTFTGGDRFDTVLFRSGAPAFEIDNVALGGRANAEGAVPELSTWGLMVLGFLGIGFVSYRHRSRPLLRFARI